MLIVIRGDNKMNMKRDNVRIIRIILDLHGVIVDLREDCSLNMKSLFYLELENGRGVIKNMETI